MKKETKKIDYDGMKTLFMNIDKCKEVNLFYEVLVEMNKEKTKQGTYELNTYYGKVKKRVSGNFKLSEYTKRVITNGTKEGYDMSEWTTNKPTGKTPISYCVYKNDKDENILYLGFESVQNFTKPKVEYLFENNPIDKVFFERWMKDSSKSQKQPQTNEVIWRTITLSNIKEFTLDSVRYVVE